MKRKNLMLTVAAVAVLGAFNPAFAGGDSAYQKDSSADASISPGVNAGSSGDQSVSSGLPSNAELSAAARDSITETPALEASAGAESSSSMGGSVASADERDRNGEKQSLN
jgi:hypothetical protein